MIPVSNPFVPTISYTLTFSFGRGLRLGESSMALVGGTNLLLGPDMTIAMSMLQ